MIKSVELSNISNVYSTTNLATYDINNDTLNICFGNNVLRGIVTATRLLQFPTTSVTPYFARKGLFRIQIGRKNLHSFARSMGYTDAIEKPFRNDSKLTVTIEAKSPLAKEMRSRVWGYTNGQYRYMLREGELMLKYKTYTIKALDNVI